MKRENIRKDDILRVIPGERFTPYGLAKKLGASAVLESSSLKKGRDRYSLLLVHEAFRIVQKENDIYFKDEKGTYSVKSKGRDILDVLMYFAKQHVPLRQDLPFPAGGIGYLSYEFARKCDDFQIKSKPRSKGTYDAEFLFGHVFIIFDHYTDILYLVGLNYREHEVDLEAAVDSVYNRINDLDFNYLAASEQKVKAGIVETGGLTKQAYLDGVNTIKHEVEAGNLLQGVLSRSMGIKTDLPALEAYRNLRSSNPSPYMFFLDFDSYQLFGASPEMLVKVKNNEAVIRPIAGTRRRGADNKEDDALEEELLADKKERAEHLMLVDLARNDLGRICEPGSVQVTEYMNVERYSHVMHIVSNVVGKLREDFSGPDAVRASFPAGTVSGAPKIKAVEIIDSIEPEDRGVYAGLVGYIEPDGSIDSCITIRSGLKKDGVIYLQAGAGIVYDSKPEREYEETREKLQALTSACGVEV